MVRIGRMELISHIDELNDEYKKINYRASLVSLMVTPDEFYAATGMRDAVITNQFESAKDKSNSAVHICTRKYYEKYLTPLVLEIKSFIKNINLDRLEEVLSISTFLASQLQEILMAAAQLNNTILSESKRLIIDLMVQNEENLQHDIETIYQYNKSTEK
jgi:hypothetical protein